MECQLNSGSNCGFAEARSQSGEPSYKCGALGI